MLPFVLLLIAQVFLSLYPLGSVPGHVAHARGWESIPLAVDAFRIFAARHLQALWSSGKLHPLVGHAGHVLQDHRAATDEIRRPRQNLHGRDAARKRGAKARVLWPDRMFGPAVRCRW